LAKTIEYFDTDQRQYAWAGMLDDIRLQIPDSHKHSGVTKFKWLTVAGSGDGTLVEEGVESIGVRNQEEWYEVLGRSKVLVSTISSI